MVPCNEFEVGKKGSVDEKVDGFFVGGFPVFTRVVHHVDRLEVGKEPFVPGADGQKVLQPARGEGELEGLEAGRVGFNEMLYEFGTSFEAEG